MVALVVFVAGLGWATSHAVRRAGRAAYLRLGVGCAAMAAMLLPAATASAAPVADAGTQSMAGMAAMAGHGPLAHAAAVAPADAGLVPSTVVLGVLLVALGLLLVVRLVESAARATARHRPAGRLLRRGHGGGHGLHARADGLSRRLTQINDLLKRPLTAADAGATVG